MMRRLVPLLIVSVFLAGCACRGPARKLMLPRGEEAIPTLAAIYEAAGLASRVFDEHSLVLSTAEGHNVVIFLEDDGGSLQAVFPCVRGGLVVDASAVSNWNATRRFSRAYLGEDGLPVMAADLVLDVTTSRKTLVEWGELLLALAEVFEDEVWPPVPMQPFPANE